MLVQERVYTATEYRFGYNGKEKNNEVSDVGNQYDYGLRIYNPRLGKFLSADPLYRDFPWNSTYSFAENRVIESIDLDGAEQHHYLLTRNDGKSKLTLTKVEDDWIDMNLQPKANYITFGERTFAFTSNEFVSPSASVDGTTGGASGGLSGYYITSLQKEFVKDPEAFIAKHDAATAEFERAILLASAVAITTEASSISPMTKTRVAALANKPNYSQIPDSKSVGPNKKFTAVQKQKILEANKQANSGDLRSDLSGKKLDPPVQSKKDVLSNMNQAEVDHIIPRSKGGSNSPSNAQVLSKKENLNKGVKEK